MIPALLAWVALLLPPVIAYPIFILSFIVLFFFDLQAVKAHMAPGWYPSLRLPLTIGVVLSLVVAYPNLLVR